MIIHKDTTKYVDNPLFSNRYKINVLINFLKEKNEDDIVNIIAINNKVKFKDFQTQPLENVVNIIDLFKIIDEYEKTSPLNDIKEEEIERVANLIYEESTRIINAQKE